MVRDRPRHHEDIGVPRRRRDEKPQPVHVVIRFIDLLDLGEAGAARTPVNETDMEGTAERLLHAVSRLAVRPHE
jgi:hypothetical protein